MLAEEEFGGSLRFLVDSAKDWKRQLYKEKVLFRSIFSERTRTVLESRCFSGNRLLSLIDLADRMIGLENDYRLNERAKESVSGTPGIEVLDSSLLDYDPQLHRGFPERYDAVLLMDNQLAQHANQDNLDKIFQKAHELLLPGGQAIISLFNYNKVLKQEYYDFSKVPFIYKGDKYYMTRHMKVFDEDILKYLVDIYDIGGHHVKSFNELHLILTKKRLCDRLISHGFIIHALYGDPEMSEFDVDRSSKMIVVAKKK